jgi:hypothetical protein
MILNVVLNDFPVPQPNNVVRQLSTLLAQE